LPLGQIRTPPLPVFLSLRVFRQAQAFNGDTFDSAHDEEEAKGSDAIPPASSVGVAFLLLSNPQPKYE
jgi:hypothetical protein